MSEILEKKPARTRRAPNPRMDPPDPRPTKSSLHQPEAGNKNNLHPAIYYVDPIAGTPDLNDCFSAAAAMGFDTVLLANPFALEHGFVSSYDALHDALGGGDSMPFLEAAAKSAKTAGIRLMLDLDISIIAPGSLLLAEYPDWFAHAGEAAAFRFLAENDATVDWWDRTLAAFQAAGIAGFRCLSATAVAAAIWRRLIQAAHERDASSKFMAWTPAVAPEAVAGLANAGFDYGFSSSCWWDFKSGWLNDDAERVAAVAPAIAMTLAPGERFEGNAAARHRALHFAAAYCAGWLMPRGFENGDFEDSGIDLRQEIAACNALRKSHQLLRADITARIISSAGAPVALLRRGHPEKKAIILAVNSSTDNVAVYDPKSLHEKLHDADVTMLDKTEAAVALLQLQPGAVEMLEATPRAFIKSVRSPAVDPNAPRIAIEAITPKVDDGEFPVRRITGDTVTVAADILTDGHDKLAADLLWRPIDEKRFRSVPMTLINNDRWTADFPLERLGRHVYAIAAWKDLYASFVDEVTKKHVAGVATRLELEEGFSLLKQTAQTAPDKTAAPLQEIVAYLEAASEETKREILLKPEIVGLMRQADAKKFLVQSREVIVDAERPAAGFATWYEIFPRSASGDVHRHGTFRDVIERLPAIAAMGFDVLYFPPIHPIGRTNRKGRNNTLTPAPDDPGSPYAIGAAEGGHDAIHPELGTLTDFHALRDEAAKLGIELALDFAIQCAPDHPWLKQHPEWFDWRPDGTIKYAENPPKKYEDIVNVDFYAKGSVPALWNALRDVVQFWADQGVRLFRVDNPHTKPLPFWQWMIADIRGRHPDAVFLAEAFTRPKLMYRLAKIGFSQSYTYFTWRNTKAELQAYLTELTTTAPRDFFRPHFFVNTPDINPEFLQNSGRAGHLIRAALAATLSGLWGVYNGFELCEAAPMPGKEEYINSEKYEIKAWDYDRPGNIIKEISQLNRIRRSNAALQSHLNIEFLNAFNDQVLYFVKIAPDGNAILAAISLDPVNVQQADIEIPLWRFGLPDDGALAAEDLMRDHRFVWHGKRQMVSLNPSELPFCIWRLQPVTN
jgi:starch synthase (maltosyl-transferring)